MALASGPSVGDLWRAMEAANPVFQVSCNSGADRNPLYTRQDVERTLAEFGRLPARARLKVGRNDPCPCGSGWSFSKHLPPQQARRWNRQSLDGWGDEVLGNSAPVALLVEEPDSALRARQLTEDPVIAVWWGNRGGMRIGHPTPSSRRASLQAGRNSDPRSVTSAKDMPEVGLLKAASRSLLSAGSHHRAMVRTGSTAERAMGSWTGKKGTQRSVGEGAGMQLTEEFLG